MTMRRSVPTLLVAAILVAATSHESRAGDPPPGAAATLAIPAVTVTPAQKRDLAAMLVVTGTLVPRDEVLVSAEIDGLRVTQLLAEEGDTVKAGQVLARLSKETLEAQLAQNDAALARAGAAIAQARSQIAQAEPTVTEAKAALLRTQSLQKSGNTTQEQMDQRLSAARTAEARLAVAQDGLVIAQAEKASQEAQRRELMIQLARTELKAPVDGLISRRSVKLGAISTSAGEPMFRLIADGLIELEAEVIETQLARLKPGAPVKVAPAGAEPVEGQVRLVPTEVDRATRLGKMRVALPRSPDLRIGSFARAEVVLQTSQGLAVPSSAVLFGGASPRVQVVRDGKVEVRAVVPGISEGGWTQIRSGLAEGEPVVSKAAAFLREGDPVRVLAEAAVKETR
jgi:HlyD family secretion protein